MIERKLRWLDRPFAEVARPSITLRDDQGVDGFHDRRAFEPRVPSLHVSPRQFPCALGVQVAPGACTRRSQRRITPTLVGNSLLGVDHIAPTGTVMVRARAHGVEILGAITPRGRARLFGMRALKGDLLGIPTRPTATLATIRRQLVRAERIERLRFSASSARSHYFDYSKVLKATGVKA